MNKTRRLLLALDPAEGSEGGPNPNSQPTYTPSDDIRAELMALAEGGDSQDSPPAAPAATAAPAAPAKPSAETPADGTQKPKDDLNIDGLIPKKREAPKAPDKPPGETATEARTPKELREAYATEKREKERLEGELKALKAQGHTPTELAKLPEYQQVMRELSESKTELDRVRGELHSRDYTLSPEFQQRYAAPVNEAFKAVSTAMSVMRVTDPETGKERRLTDAEIIQISKMETDIDRSEKLHELFGPNAVRVVAQMERLAEAGAALQAAHLDAKQNGSTRLKEQAAKQAESQRAVVAQYQEAVNQITAADPDLYAPLPDTDPDASEFNPNQAAAKVLATVAFLGREGTPRETIVRAQAACTARIIGFEKLQHTNRTLTNRISELEKELAQHKQAEPPTGGGDPSGERSNGPIGYEAEIRALAD